MKCQVQIKYNGVYASPTQCTGIVLFTSTALFICTICIHPAPRTTVMYTTICRMYGDILIIFSEEKEPDSNPGPLLTNYFFHQNNT
jgi:hypothetical protein